MCLYVDGVNVGVMERCEQNHDGKFWTFFMRNGNKIQIHFSAIKLFSIRSVITQVVTTYSENF